MERKKRKKFRGETSHHWSHRTGAWQAPYPRRADSCAHHRRSPGLPPDLILGGQGRTGTSVVQSAMIFLAYTVMAAALVLLVLIRKGGGG